MISFARIFASLIGNQRLLSFEGTYPTALIRYLRPSLLLSHFNLLDLLLQRNPLGLSQQCYAAQADDAEKYKDAHDIDVVALEIAEIDGTRSRGQGTKS